MRLHLLDVTFELFRAFYGLPFERGPGGGAVHGVRGLIITTLGLLREPAVTHLAGATDQVIESFRNDLYAGYKTGEGIDPDLWSEFPLAEEALRCLGVTLWEMVEFEADDALATAAHRFAGEVDQVVILSPDKDLTQCVRGERVVTHDRMRRKTYAEPDVIEKFGVRPESIPDYLALVGDTADGIPGIRGWGKKSAGVILASYDHLEAIPRDPSQWRVPLRGAAKLADALFSRFDDALLFRTLATLRTDVPLKETLPELEWRGARPEYRDFCDRLGLSNLREAPFR